VTELGRRAGSQPSAGALLRRRGQRPQTIFVGTLRSQFWRNFRGQTAGKTWEEHPDMAAVPGTRPFEGHRGFQLATGAKERRRVFRPAWAIEVQGEEPAGLVGQQRVDPDHELPPALFLTLSAQVVTDDGERERSCSSASSRDSAAERAESSLAN